MPLFPFSKCFNLLYRSLEGLLFCIFLDLKIIIHCIYLVVHIYINSCVRQCEIARIHPMINKGGKAQPLLGLIDHVK